MAAVALSRLMNLWMEAIRNLPEGETSSQTTDRLILASLLLAREDAQLVKGTCSAEVNACLALARSGSWAELDEIPWLLVQGYVSTGVADGKTTRQVERLLDHGSSNIRQWFHYVAWMIRADLEVDTVRPRLLLNLADKLGGLSESAGLLAVLHPDKSVLDSEADTFTPPEGFKVQFKTRLKGIREQQWNSFGLNYWLAENTSRKLIWDSIKEGEHPRAWALLADLGAVTQSSENGVGTITYLRDHAFRDPNRLEPLIVDLAEQVLQLGLTHVTSTTPWGSIIAQRIGSLIEVPNFAGDPTAGARFALCMDILGPAPEHVAAAHAALMGRPECIAVIGLINAMGNLPAGPAPYFAIDPAVPATLPPTLRSVGELRIVDAEFGES